jgi:tetratricopeptide (TPR) repeat protein
MTNTPLRGAAALMTGCLLLVWGCGTQSPPVRTTAPRLEAPARTVASTAKPIPGNSYYYYIESQLARRRGDLPQSVANLERAIAGDPESHFLYHELAELYLRQQDKQKALAVIEKVLQKDPEDVETLIIYGRIKQGLDDLEAAAEAFEKALRLDPQRRNVYLVLGNLYLEHERLKDAERVYRQLIDRFPDAYAGHFFLGKVYAQQNRRQQAEQELERTLEIKSDLLQPRFELIELYQSDPDSPEIRRVIIHLYQEILDKDPNNVRALIGLSWRYLQDGRRDQALTLLQDLGRRSLKDSQVLRIVAQQYLETRQFEAGRAVLDGMLTAVPDNAELHYLDGLACDGLEDAEAALNHFLKVTPESTFYQNAAVHIGFIYQETGRLKEAIRHLESVMGRYPDNPDFPLYLGSFYEQAESYDQAEAVLLKGLKIDPDNPRLHFRLGVVYDKWGDKERSIEEMKTVIRLDPKHANALNYLGYTYADLGIHLTEAEDYIRRALAESPEDGYITDSLGWVFYKKGDYRKSLEYLLKAVKLVPDDPIILEHVGDAYQKLEEREKALKFYRQSLENKNTEPEARKEKIDRLMQ